MMRLVLCRTTWYHQGNVGLNIPMGLHHAERHGRSGSKDHGNATGSWPRSRRPSPSKPLDDSAHASALGITIPFAHIRTIINRNSKSEVLPGPWTSKATKLNRSAW